MLGSQFRALALAGAAGLGAFALIAAQRPAVLAKVSGGLWEVSSSAAGTNAARLCLADPAALARFEHRSAKCSLAVISDTPSEAVVDYRCSGGGFGRTRLTVLTPRSMRIETQGISNNAPFAYTLQVRRVGDCGGR